MTSPAPTPTPTPEQLAVVSAWAAVIDHAQQQIDVILAPCASKFMAQILALPLPTFDDRMFREDPSKELIDTLNAMAWAISQWPRGFYSSELRTALITQCSRWGLSVGFSGKEPPPGTRFVSRGNRSDKA